MTEFAINHSNKIGVIYTVDGNRIHLFRNKELFDLWKDIMPQFGDPPMVKSFKYYKMYEEWVII